MTATSGKPAPAPPSFWASGPKYEAYVGRWSRAVAREFVAWLSIAEQRSWLDVGCGTGALSSTILDIASPTTVLGLDPSHAFASHAYASLATATAHVIVGDAQALPLAGDAFDACVSGLVLNFIPRPETAVAEMRRVTRSGGIVAAYVWDYAEGMQFMRLFWDAAAATHPDSRRLDEARRFTVTSPAALEGLFTEAGLAHVETRAIDIPTVFRDFDDLWSPFLGGQGPGPSYVASLTDEGRDALREELRASAPTTAEGSIPLTARAWAAKATRS